MLYPSPGFSRPFHFMCLYMERRGSRSTLECALCVSPPTTLCQPTIYHLRSESDSRAVFLWCLHGLYSPGSNLLPVLFWLVLWLWMLDHIKFIKVLHSCCRDFTDTQLSFYLREIQLKTVESYRLPLFHFT